MALFQLTKKVRERYPQLNFYGVKVEDVQTTKKLLYVKARKKRIQRDFREMYTLENLKEVPQVKAMRDLFVAMGDDPEKNLTALDVEAEKALEVAVDLVTTSSLGSAGAIGKFSVE
jgi:DNA/RNA-binding domain of Phe-tRNA-synthetase-like protein